MSLHYSSTYANETLPIEKNGEDFSFLLVWFDNVHQAESGRTASISTTVSINHGNINETIPSHHSKSHSQALASSQHHTSQHHTSHHQSGQQQHSQYSGQPYWNSYNNSRRSGSGSYTRNYSGGSNEFYWSQKSSRFPSHRSINNLMTNSSNYQQQSQSSPPTQRRQSEQQQQYYHSEQQQQSSQTYFKSRIRYIHDRIFLSIDSDLNAYF